MFITYFSYFYIYNIQKIINYISIKNFKILMKYLIKTFLLKNILINKANVKNFIMKLLLDIMN